MKTDSDFIRELAAMPLHSIRVVIVNGATVSILRVPGGWLYTTGFQFDHGDTPHNHHATTFVPLP